MFISSPTEKPGVALCNSSYCHAQLPGRRCRTEQGFLPGGVGLEGSPSSKLATKTQSFSFSY